jgi:glucosamine--fructose-6-phosphate aminotransferase (isomerizing)
MATTLDRPTITLDEILSQPQCWAACLDTLDRAEVIRKICAQVPPDADWLFIGCGTSYYIALSAAASFAAITGMPARAVPASEILFFPDAVLGKCATTIPVLISRSGKTTEVVRAAQYLERERDMRCIAITCYGDQPLAQTSALPIVLDAAAEKSTVMTRSFSSMLMGLQFLAASVAGSDALLEGLRQLPSRSTIMFQQAPGLVRDFVSRHDLDNYSFLGQGPLFGIANEAMLKVMESSCSYAQVFHSLEFRHGPKSIVSPRSLLVFFMSDQAYAAETALLEEMKALGATTMTVTSQPSSRIRAATDLLVQTPAGSPECSRLAACALAGQLLGLYTGLKKGLDPDSPRHLSQVVILKETL